MKKLICKLLIVSLLLGMLTGCGSVPSGETEPETVPESGTDATAAQGESVEATTEEQRVPSILDNKIPVDGTAGLYYIPSTIFEQGMSQTLYRFQEHLLTIYSKYDMSISASRMYFKLVSVETGEIIREAELSGIGYATAQVFEDRIAAFDSVNRKAYILDGSLQLIAEYPLEGWAVYFDSAITRAYCFDFGQGLRVMDLVSGQVSDGLPGKADVTALGINGNDVTIKYTDLDTLLFGIATLDLETGEIAELKLDESVITAENVGDFWLAGIYREDGAYLLGSMEQARYFVQGDFAGMPRLLGGSLNVLLNTVGTDGTLTMELYDSAGRFLSSFTKGSSYSGPVYDPVWFEEYSGYFLTIMDDTGAEQLYFWDLSEEMPGEDLVLIPLDGVSDSTVGTVVAGELYDRAQQISEKFGVTVKIAELAKTEYMDYIGEQCYDETQISAALDTLKCVLASYPEGFIDQLYHGNYRKIEIHLTGALDHRNAEQPFVGNLTGFMEKTRDKFVVAVNIYNDSPDQILYHEFSHIIEDKLQFDADYREDALFSEETWAGFNPEWFAYFGDVNVYPEYTMSYEYSLYFNDGYAGTDPGEDRGRIMQYAAAGVTARFIGYPGIVAKLEFYCQCIRDAFDTTGWPEETVWEQTLSRVK
ncbi:MAG: hypothetical protein IJZ85_13915 [Lachnospiraceae bacterium]|nr:hypothetical protein [Lachnospiraceae bacterium]